MLRRRQLIPYPWGQRLLGVAAAFVAILVLLDPFGGDQSPDGEVAEKIPSATQETDGRGTTSEELQPLDLQPVRLTLREALADISSGSVEAAVIVDGSDPIVDATSDSNPDRRFRLWSVSKVLAGISLLQRLGWDDVKGEPITPEVQSWLEGALIRSENCPQRAMTLKLQELAGGTGEARELINTVSRMAKAKIVVDTQTESPEPPCDQFLSLQNDLAEPLAPALLLGTSTWRIEDASRLFSALQQGTLGSELSSRLLRLLRRKKGVSREIQPGEYTAAPAWGAGEALRSFEPAYKAGWGGTQDGAFLAEQVAAMSIAGHDVVIAVAFHPDVQPPVDDPGRTDAPSTIETVQRKIAETILRLARGT